MKMQPWAISLSQILAVCMCVSATRPSIGKRLVPYKSTASVVARSIWKRDIVPKDVVRLYYTEEAGVRPSTSLQFTAHRDVPIVALEEIEYLFLSILCRTDSGQDDAVAIHLLFDSDDAKAETMAAWSAFEKFILITSHTSCNPSDERGAWMISSVRGNSSTFPSFSLTLEAQSIPLRQAGSSLRLLHVADNVGSSWGLPQEQRSLPPHGLGRRLVDKLFSLGHDFNFAPRQKLFPIDISLDNTTEDTTALTSTATDLLQDLEVTCVNCVSQTNFSIGLDIDISSSGTKLNAAYINATVLQFQHNIQLEFALNSSKTIQEVLDVVRTPLPALGISLPDIGDIGFFVGASVIMDLETFGALNFSIGANTTIPQGATATFVLKGPENSSATGWDAATFDIIPFRLNGGELNVTAGISLSPFIEASISILDTISANARVYVNTPHVSAAATVKTNVNRQCQPVGPEDFESFSTAATFGAGLNFTIEATTDGSLVSDEDVDLFTRGTTLGNLPSIDSPACFIIADDNTAGDTVTVSGQLSDVVPVSSLAGQVPAATGTLLAAAVAVPTFDVLKIESFFSAHRALPTNVNYTQMAQATQIPSDLQKAVNKVLGNGDLKSLPRRGWKTVFAFASAVALVLLL